MDKMTDCATAFSDIERYQINLKSKSVNWSNKRKKKKNKHKLNEAGIMPEAIVIGSDNTLNNIVYNEEKEKCIFVNSNEKNTYRRNKKHTKREKEHFHKKKNEYKFINPNDVTDCEVTEIATFEKSDKSVNSNKFHKRKKKVTDAINVSDCKNLEIDMQEFENNTNIETLKKSNKHEKKLKHKSLDEIEYISNNRIKKSEETENNIILNELYKRKRSRKQTKNDKMLDCLNTNLYDCEQSQYNLNTEISNGIYKKKRKKRRKLDTVENLPTTIEVKSNHISDNSMDRVENLPTTIKVKSNHISDNSMDREDKEDDFIENCYHENVPKLKRKKNKYPEIKPHNYQKKKYKSEDGTNTFDCKIAETTTTEKSHDNISSNNFHKKKKKYKGTDNENRIAETDKQGLENDSNIKFLKVLRKQKKKEKQNLLNELDDAFSYQNSTANKSEKNKVLNGLEVRKKKDKHKQNEVDQKFDSNIEENLNGLNNETLHKFQKKKKKKHKHKLLNEVENTSDGNIPESTIDVCREDKKRYAEKISDYKIGNSDIIEINQNYLNNENFNIFQKNKKKKHKQKLLNEMENISNSKTADSIAVGFNQNDLSIETLNSCHKKKKHKHNLLGEMEDIYQNIQESAVAREERNRIIDVSDMEKGNKETDVDKISSYRFLDSNNLEINLNDLNSQMLTGHKQKRKKHRHKLTEENMAMTAIESNNTLKDDRPPRTKRNKKKHSQSRIEMVLSDFHEKEKNASSKELEKNCQENTYMSFDPFIHDMKEVPVTFPVPLLHEGETAASILPTRRVELEKNGITIHDGKWTKEEDDILTRNFLQFGFEFGVNNPFQLLGINQNHKIEKLAKFLRAKHFYVRLGKDLNNRTLRSIYMRSRKLFNPLNKGRLSAEETADLKHAYKLVGNKWTRISDILSRSDNNCLNAYRWCRKDINKGKWTPEEETNLIKAIKSVTGSEDISANNVKNISWQTVAMSVPTRNEFQCHKYWAQHLAWDSSVTEKKKWEKCHYGKLIYLIKDKYNFNSEYEIDWREVHKHFKQVAPSFIFLRKKWSYMKGRIPKKLGLSFSEYLNALAKLYVEQYKMFADAKC